MQPQTPPARPSVPWPGLALAGIGAVAFSGKAIIVKLAYRYGVDAVTLIMLRMLFALPMFVAIALWAALMRPSPIASAPWRYGGATRGNGGRPSTTSSSPVSSPHMYAPAPR